ncbi:hypothetical protein BJ085DRAFT_30488 [Dimargaris cristalligena]|uniref:Uncharacterized protein n=1 Tax=Dimargaris cristalligena TaxID=215637 RepID=A0A4Q0A4G8_9FUNG|nr:hypothetical protein BJ085DRAFT_30488 [Dimargaris cristalligena]|eukprot:RKP40471.1 hypothetical protein BJ085DRAFT_30488 [Dimargaris cristalligena]
MVQTTQTPPGALGPKARPSLLTDQSPPAFSFLSAAAPAFKPTLIKRTSQTIIIRDPNDPSVVKNIAALKASVQPPPPPGSAKQSAPTTPTPRPAFTAGDAPPGSATSFDAPPYSPYPESSVVSFPRLPDTPPLDPPMELPPTASLFETLPNSLPARNSPSYPKSTKLGLVRPFVPSSKPPLASDSATHPTSSVPALKAVPLARVPSSTPTLTYSAAPIRAVATNPLPLGLPPLSGSYPMPSHHHSGQPPSSHRRGRHLFTADVELHNRALHRVKVFEHDNPADIANRIVREHSVPSPTTSAARLTKILQQRKGQALLGIRIMYGNQP